jgi:hypothetical protein
VPQRIKVPKGAQLKVTTVKSSTGMRTARVRLKNAKDRVVDTDVSTGQEQVRKDYVPGCEKLDGQTQVRSAQNHGVLELQP